MRAYLKLTPTNKQIPFDHQHLLVGTIHKWLGDNDEHGTISLYSFSRLEKAISRKNGLLFDEQPYFFFSAHKPELVKRLINGIRKDPSMFLGLSVEDITIMDDPDLSGQRLFYPASPIFIKRRMDNKIEQIIYDNPDAPVCIKETLMTKMEKIGLSDDTLQIHFDTSYQNAGTKLILYKGIKNKASWCPIIIEGKPETKLFAWNVGLGNSTGIGFGAIK